MTKKTKKTKGAGEGPTQSTPVAMPPFFRPHTDQTQQSPAVAASQPAPVQLVSEDPRLSVAPECATQSGTRRLRIRVQNPDWRRAPLGRAGAWVPEGVSPLEAIDVLLLHLAAVGDLALAFDLFVKLVARACGVSYALMDVQPDPSIAFDVPWVLRDWSPGQAADLLEAQAGCTLEAAGEILLANMASCASPTEGFAGLVRVVAEECRLGFTMTDVCLVDDTGEITAEVVETT